MPRSAPSRAALRGAAAQARRRARTDAEALPPRRAECRRGRGGRARGRRVRHAPDHRRDARLAARRDRARGSGSPAPSCGPSARSSTRMTSLDEVCLTGSRRSAWTRSPRATSRTPLAPATTPIENPAKDELGRLSPTFNPMLGKAKASIDSYNAMRGELNEVADRGRRRRQHRRLRLPADGLHVRGGRPRRRRDRLRRDRRRPGRRAPGADGRVRPRGVQEASRAAVAAPSPPRHRPGRREARGVAHQGVRAAAQATDAIRGSPSPPRTSPPRSSSSPPSPTRSAAS